MKKIDLIQKLKQLEGITQDERAYLINLVNTKKKYGLVWEDKPEDVEEILRENLPVLKEVKDKAIFASAAKKKNDTLFNDEEQSSSIAPNHILIEGDNLHALTALTFTHENKIDVIYIDPPYNTGNKDFKYNDSFVDKEDSYRHSKWLSFMSKRLEIAKRLLKDTGIIFISIDDNEQAQLKLLCAETFGQNCFVETIVWKNKYGPGAMTKGFGNIHEYIIAYTKQELQSIESELNEEDKKNYKGKDEHFQIRGGYITQPLATKSKDDRPNLVYPVLYDGVEIWPDKQWIWSQERLLEAQKKNYLQFNESDGKLGVRFKQYLKDENGVVRKGKPISIFIGPYNQDGTKELEDFFKSKIFNNPKPSTLLRKLISMTVNAIDNKQIKILDFFAGSGTTLHATMLLNAEDGGNRQCILVTNNENNICEEVTYERNKKAIQGYTNAKGVKVEGLGNNNLRYFKSEFVSRDASIKNKKEITILATELLCIKEDIYTEQKTIGGYKLNATYVKCFKQHNVYLLALYDEDVIEQMVEVMQTVIAGDKERKTHFKVYVFSNGQYPYTEEFEEVLPYITLCALPDAIYKAYQNVLPQRQRKHIPELEEPTPEDMEVALEDKSPIDLFNQRS